MEREPEPKAEKAVESVAGGVVAAVIVGLFASSARQGPGLHWVLGLAVAAVAAIVGTLPGHLYRLRKWFLWLVAAASVGASTVTTHTLRGQLDSLRVDLGAKAKALKDTTAVAADLRKTLARAGDDSAAAEARRKAAGRNEAARKRALVGLETRGNELFDIACRWGPATPSADSTFGKTVDAWRDSVALVIGSPPQPYSASREPFFDDCMPNGTRWSWEIDTDLREIRAALEPR